MKRIKAVLMAQLDYEQIVGYTQRLENSFRHFMVSHSFFFVMSLIFVQNTVMNFIARQTLLMRSEMAALPEKIVQMTRMAEKGGPSIRTLVLELTIYDRCQGRTQQTRGRRHPWKPT